MKRHRDRFFKGFLIIYVGFLVVHSFALDWSSWLVPAALVLGLGVAALAHTRYGALTIGLLLIHMVLEWTEHAQHGWQYSPGEIVLHGIHACLDFVFLYQELKMHAGKYSRLALLGIVCGLAALFAASYTPAPRDTSLLVRMRQQAHASGHGNENGPIEPFVIGGMFGCILSHLLRKRSV